jgi:hypothetical protein
LFIPSSGIYALLNRLIDGKYIPIHVCNVVKPIRTSGKD